MPRKLLIDDLIGAAAGSLGGRIDTLETATAYASVLQESWAGLQAMTGAGDGQSAEVLASDNGTHGQATATGYTGDTVTNAGRYAWSAAWSRWVRVAEAGMATLEGRIGGMQDAADLVGRGQADYTGSGNTVPIIADGLCGVLMQYDRLAGTLSGVGLLPPTAPVPLTHAVDSSAFTHLLVCGQSLSLGVGGTPVLSVSQPYANVMFDDGSPGTTAEPGTQYKGGSVGLRSLMEEGLETPVSGACAYATTLRLQGFGGAAADKVLLGSSGGTGGTSITEHRQGAAGDTHGRWERNIADAHALDPAYTLPCVIWCQGERDVSDGMDQASYLAHLTGLQTEIEAEYHSATGKSGAVYLVTYQTSFDADQNPGPALAQLQAAQETEKVVLLGPTYRFPYSEDVHLSHVGYRLLGCYAGRAFHQIAVEGVRPLWLNPVGATRTGRRIRVRFQVPHRPLGLDTTRLGATTDYGFRVTDSGGTVALAEIFVSGDDVVIDLAADPAGPVTVRYALDYNGQPLMTGGSGNLRDSAPERTTIDGVEYQLFNAAPAFSLIAQEVEA